MATATEGQDHRVPYSLHPRRIIAALIGMVAAGAAAFALFAPATGANFTASDTGSVHVATATLNLSLSDANHTGTFDANFTNLKPGEQQTRVFYVKNTGSIPATVKIGNPVSGVTFSAPAGQNPNPADLMFGVDNYKALTSATSIGTSIDLGNIAAGQTKAYTLRVALSSNAGNEWQDVSLDATATVTLTQA